MKFSDMDYALAQGGCPRIEKLKFDRLLLVILYLCYHWNSQKGILLLIHIVRCRVLGDT